MRPFWASIFQFSVVLGIIDLSRVALSGKLFVGHLERVPLKIPSPPI